MENFGLRDVLEPNRPPAYARRDGRDDFDEPASARRLASSAKTSAKAGTLRRSLLKSAFEMIETFTALQARIVAFRVLSESNAISPKYSP